MAKDRLVGALILAAAALITILAFFQIYYLGCSGDADLLWKGNTAYLLVHGERRGYHTSYLGYSGQVIKGYFGAGSLPDDVAPYTLILRITPSGVQRYEENRSLSIFTPWGENLYAWHSDGRLLKWMGTRFDEASVEERKRFPTWPSIPPKSIDNAGGWSARYSITSGPNDELSLQLDETPITVLVTPLNIYDGEVGISVSINGGPPQRVFHRIGKPTRVSGKEYERAFPR